MKKVLLFPYHPDVDTLMEHESFMKGYRVTGLISYKEDADLVKEFNTILGAENLTEQEMIQNCDVVVFLDNYRGYRTEKYDTVLQNALSHGKEVYVSPLVAPQLDLTKDAGRCQTLGSPPDESGENPPAEKMYDINVPVIAVMGQGKNCNKFDNQLLLTQVLEQDGYAVKTIASNPLGMLFGYAAMPSFLFDESCSVKTKILRFNHCINKLVQDESPDVIVLGIPEGGAPFEKGEFNHFGEYTFVISKAAPVDMGIFCCYLMQPGPDLIDHLNEQFQSRFDVPIDAVSISKNTIERASIMEDLKYDFLYNDHLDKYYPKLEDADARILNMRDLDEAKATIRAVLKRLQENAEVV